MLFTINAGNEFESFRLKFNERWDLCPNPSVLLEDDFRTPERQTILDLQTTDRQIVVNGQRYTANPEMGFDIADMSILHYTIYCFREIFPQNPRQPQLEQVMLGGDDNLNNTLILGIDGLFRLVRPEDVVHDDPEIVLQFEGFRRGNGFVGPGIQDNQFANDMMAYFHTAMHFWRNHLRDHEVHYHTDELEGGELDKLLDIFDELTRLQQNFQPEYSLDN